MHPGIITAHMASANQQEFVGHRGVETGEQAIKIPQVTTGCEIDLAIPGIETVRQAGPQGAEIDTAGVCSQR